MIGKIKLSGQGGLDINGVTEEYTAGGNISVGGFVKLVSNKVQKVTSASDTILGVAKTGATTGQTVKVVVPNI